MIDWQFFFLAWELKGKFPAILEQPAARELYDDAHALLDEIVARRLAPGRAACTASGRRAPTATTSCSTSGDALPDAAPADGEAGDSRPNRCLADYVAPGGRPPRRASRSRSTAPTSSPRGYEAEHDDYRAIMVKALADRLAEAFAEYLHLQARRDWYEPDADADERGPASPSASAASGRRSATRPARTTPRSGELFDLLGAERARARR